MSLCVLLSSFSSTEDSCCFLFCKIWVCCASQLATVTVSQLDFEYLLIQVIIPY